MKKILSLVLCVALLLPLLSGDVLAVEAYTTSEKGLSFIAEYETGSADESLEQVAERLRGKLGNAEDAVNNFLFKHAIRVTQEQFDAMVSMTWALGTQWIDPEYRFCAYLINGIHHYSEVQVVNSIASWCHIGTTMADDLAQRRLREAYLFLYGEYENNASEEYTYIHYNINGGKIDHSTVFYPIGEAYGELPVSRQSGKSFQGWYTSDGVLLTGEEIALEPMYVTARWTDKVSEKIDYSKWKNPFSDLKKTDWYFGYVRELSVRGVIDLLWN